MSKWPDRPAGADRRRQPRQHRSRRARRRSVDHTGRYRGQRRRPGAAGHRPTRWPLRLRSAATRVRTSPSRAAERHWWRAPFQNTTTCCCPPSGSPTIGDVDTAERRVRLGAGVDAGCRAAGGGPGRTGVRRRPGGPRFRDGRRHGVDERGRSAHRALREHGRTGRRARGRAARRVGGATTQRMFAATTPVTTWLRCSSAPRARSA